MSIKPRKLQIRPWSCVFRNWSRFGSYNVILTTLEFPTIATTLNYRLPVSGGACYHLAPRVALYNTFAILAMKMHLKLQLKDSVVLVTWLGIHPCIPWLLFVIKTSPFIQNSSKMTKSIQGITYHVSTIIEWTRSFGSIANQSACCRWFTSGYFLINIIEVHDKWII